MIHLDVNVLVYAFRPDDERQERYRTWLTDTLVRRDEIGLVDAVVSGFVRVVTNPRVTRFPASSDLAMAFVNRLRSAPSTRWSPGGGAVWQVVGELVEADPSIAGNRIPDVYLAASAIAHRARLATADHGFAAYPGLRWFDPASG